MHAFKWITNKLREFRNPYTDTRPTMGDLSKRDTESINSMSSNISLSERIQNGRRQLGKEITIVRLQVRSEVPGVIDGDITIPVVLDVNMTWHEVFKILKIKIDPEFHLFRAYGRFIEDFSAPIYKLYHTYKTKRDTYYATIIARDDEDGMHKKKVKGRKKASSKTCNALSASNKGHRKRTLPKRKCISNNSPIKSNIQQRSRKEIPSTTMHYRKTASPGIPHPISINNGPSSNDNDSDHDHQGEIDERETREGGIMFRFQPPSGFALPPSRPFQAPTMTGGEFEPPQLAFRDESTMAGDILLPEEVDLKPKILRYLSGHCSNRDMLSIRTELMSLKQATKFQSLNRLIPFTAGILQNAFLDELK